MESLTRLSLSPCRYFHMQQIEAKVNGQPQVQYHGPFVHMAGLLPSGGGAPNFTCSLIYSLYII